MNFAGNFKVLGVVDIRPIQDLVLELMDVDWDSDAFRQRRYEVHRDTQTVGLVFDSDFRHSHPTRLPLLQKFQEPLRPALELVAEYFEDSEHGRELVRQFGLGYFVRATLVKLKAGGVISAHTDNNFSLVHSHRIHLPLMTNDAVMFAVGKETINMRESTLYEINNRREHSVTNGGDRSRIHLILDFVLPGEKCCCGAKRHPHTLCSPNACRDTDLRQISCRCFPEE